MSDETDREIQRPIDETTKELVDEVVRTISDHAFRGAFARVVRQFLVEREEELK